MTVESNIPEIVQGNTFQGMLYEILVNGVAKDLTNTEIKITFRRGGRTGSVAKTFSAGSGITKTDPVNGVFRLDAFRNNWQPGIYHFDVRFKDPGDVYKTWIRGTWPVEQYVTGDE